MVVSAVTSSAAMRYTRQSPPASRVSRGWRSKSHLTDYDHSNKISYPRTYPLIVGPIIGPKRLSKVLMDGGRDHNIMYAETFDALGIARSALHPSTAPIHGITLGNRAHPLGRIVLPVTFGDLCNFCSSQLQLTQDTSR